MTSEIKERIAAINSGIVPEGYKKTKVGIVPVEWEETTYGALGRFVKGKEVSSSNVTETGFPAMMYGDIYVKYDTKFDSVDYHISEETAAKSTAIHYGDLLFTCSGETALEIGKCVCYRGDEAVYIGGDILALTPTKDDSLFLSYQQNSFPMIKQKARLGQGHSVVHIYPEPIKSMYCVLPPLPEQQKIAEILSTQDKLIALQEKKIEQLNKLKKAYLQKMFPTKGSNYPELRFQGFTDAWEQRKLGDISDSYSGGTPTAGKSEYYGGDIPFIRSAEVNSDSTELFLTEEGLKNSSAKMVNNGDILYALYGATSGEVGLARLNGAINQAILDIKPHANYDAQFIMQWLRKSKENIISTYLQGGQGNLSGTIVTSLMVDCPTYSEQQKIGDYFRNLDTLITLHQRKLDQEKQKKKALMQLLLTGKARIK